VNEWKNDAAINVLFSPSEQGFDIAEKILDWIDEEQEFIFISVFSLNLFSGKRSGRDLLTTLKRAKDRGVMIWIVTDRKQSDGPSGFGRPFDDLLRKELGGSTNFVMYEVINDVGRWNAMHFKDAIFGVSRVKIVTDTANWSSAAMGSCFSATKTGIKPKEYCSKESSTESTLFIDGKFMPGGNKFGFRMLKNHLGLLDKYYRQIDVQGNGDPTPAVAWERLVGRFPSIPFQRTTVYVEHQTRPGEFLEMRAGLCPANDAGACDLEPELSYPNRLNGDSLPLKQTWRQLDWDAGLALDWTCDRNDGGASYVNDGYGYDPKAKGCHQWRLLAYIDGKKGDWFEFKVVKTQGIAGPVLEWEADIGAEELSITDEAGQPAPGAPRRASKNHRGRLGYTTRAVFKRKQGPSARLQ